MIYGNKLLDESFSNIELEMRYILESIGQGDILQESLKDKISKFLDLFKKKEVIKLGQLGKTESILKMNIDRIKLSKENIVFDKPKKIEELDWKSLLININKSIDASKAKKLLDELIYRYNDSIDEDFDDKATIEKYEKEILTVKQQRDSMFPDIVFSPHNMNADKYFSHNVDCDTFLKEFNNLFKDKTLRGMGLYSVREFKNSNEVNEYIRNIGSVQDEIVKLTDQINKILVSIFMKISEDKYFYRLEEREEFKDLFSRYKTILASVATHMGMAYTEMH